MPKMGQNGRFLRCWASFVPLRACQCACMASFVPLWACQRACMASFVPLWACQRACMTSFLPKGPSSMCTGRVLSRIALERGPPGKCVEAKVAGPIAARHCHIWPGGGPAIPSPAPALAPASCRRGQPWPVSVRYTRNRLRATMTAAMRKPVTRRGRLFA